MRTRNRTTYQGTTEAEVDARAAADDDQRYLPKVTIANCPECARLANIAPRLPNGHKRMVLCEQHSPVDDAICPIAPFGSRSLEEQTKNVQFLSDLLNTRVKYAKQDKTKNVDMKMSLGTAETLARALTNYLLLHENDTVMVDCKRCGYENRVDLARNR